MMRERTIKNERPATAVLTGISRGFGASPLSSALAAMKAFASAPDMRPVVILGILSSPFIGLKLLIEALALLG